jgi:signal transduction histidine kinase
MAIVPLVANGQQLGAVAAINSADGAFRTEDLDVLGTVARQTALRLENMRLQEAVQRQTRELEALRRLAEIHTASEGLDAILNTSVRAFAEVLQCDKVCVLLHDEERNVLLAQRAAVGIRESVLDAVCVPADDMTIAGAVLRTGAPVVSNDAASDSWVDSYLRESLGIRQVLAVPLMAHGTPMGVLLAMDSVNGSFDDEDVNLATNVAGYAATVLSSGRSHEQDRAMVHQLREVDHTKSDFISMLAHELKGPMTTVLGFSHMLQGDSIPPERRSEVLDIISREVSRLSRLVSDLLDTSRMDAGNLNYAFEPVDLSEVLESILSVHPSLASKHLLTSNVPDGLPRVNADPDRLRQALLNLLTNATRYSPSGTLVTVEADVIEEPDGPRVRVSVTDEGIGISDEDKIKVFSKFVMLEKPNWTTKGTGLGLYITKGIVESHGGRIWVESEPGSGSIFRMTLVPATER